MCTTRHNNKLIRQSLLYFEYKAEGGIPLWFAWTLAVVLLVCAGITYCVLASNLERIIAKPIKLPVPLSAFPLQIGNWTGKDLSIPSTTKEYMKKNFADDYFNRRYSNSVTKTWADVYVVYCSSRPGGILGHRPRVCYTGYGWIHDSTQTGQFISRAGHQIPYLIHRFHKPVPMNDQTVALNFYVLNGKLTAEEKDFSGILGRKVNISGDLAQYVAQVQISSRLENPIRMMAKDMVDLILDYLPDQDGEVRAVNYHNFDKK
jgi:hypothetical protein